MTTYKGRDGRLKVGANTVAEVRSFNFTITAARGDDSTLEDEWDTHKSVTKSWAGQAQVWWDPADANGQGGLEAGDEPTISLYPTGTDAGKVFYTGAVHVDSVQITNERDGIVSADIQFTGNGICTRSTVGA
ncbi:hypothetical protein [Reyranella sp.]|uniref:hypothetical protein n=1 Tax=Reyranella sp. TaxID=1929291 RepID=UPI003D151CE0